MYKTAYTFGKATEMTYEEALERIPGFLQEEGFGVLTEIDVSATLKKKIGADFRKYMILGACNPNLAHRALQAENEIGALLPCNVIVYENDEGKAVVSIMDPPVALGLVGKDEIADIAKEAKERLSRVIDRL
jgi:uncharacterized protein (DUF302 family)